MAHKRCTKQLHPFKTKTLIIHLMSALPILSTPIFAQEASWIGPNGGNFWEDSYWSTGEIPGSGSDRGIIQGNNLGMNVVLSNNDPNANLYLGLEQFILGHGANNKANLDIMLLPDYSPLTLQGDLIIGSTSGQGNLSFEKIGNRDYGHDISIQSLLLGDGLNSAGRVNLLGQGKQLSEQTSRTKHALGMTDLIAGNNGGLGNLTADGTAVLIDSMPNPNYYQTTPTFILGKGLGSVGEVNILGAGKLGVSMVMSTKDFDTNQGAIIGSEGGTGKLTISGQIMGADHNPLPSRAMFTSGMAIGQDNGSLGEVNVLEGGLLRTYANATYDEYTAQNTYLIEIGANGGTGNGLISGNNSRWEISGDTYAMSSGTGFGAAGKLELGGTGTGTLTINHNGVVALGKTQLIYNYDDDTGEGYYDYEFLAEGGTLTIAETAMGNGTLNIGAARSDQAAAAGTLTTDKVIFGLGDGRIVFNHTATDYQFDPELSGKGTLVNHSGTTWINGNNHAFSGHIELSGGMLGVRHDAALGTAGISVTQNATLTYANDVLLSNDIDIKPNAILQAMVASGKSAEQKGIISGTGQFQKMGQGQMSLSGNNTLMGDTLVNEGTLNLINEGALPSSRVAVQSLLNIEAVNGQTAIKSLAGNGLVMLGNNTLNINLANDEFKGSLQGIGTFNVKGGTQILSGNNQQFEGNIAIEQAGHLVAYAPKNLGDAPIHNSGQLTLDIRTPIDWYFINDLSGSGELIKRGIGTLYIDTDQAYTGKTTLENGRLILQSTLDGSASLASALVDIKPNGILGGYGRIKGDVINAGTILVGGAINSNEFNGNKNEFGHLTIGGNYIGQGGIIFFDTVLGGDGSPSDRLVIEGNASGTAKLLVNNIHGSGAITSKGIELIDIKGTSSAEFSLSGRAVAGAYEYQLVQGKDGHWYLRSNSDNGHNGHNLHPFIPGNNGAMTPIYRPEIGSYLANISSVNTLFTHQLHDRIPQSIGPNGQSLWTRIVGQHERFNDSTRQLHTTTNNQVVQLGGDILTKSFAADGLMKFGAMFGYGHTKSTTKSNQFQAHSATKGDGYALGIYGTWFQKNSELTGAYVDSWIQYVHFDNEVKGNHLRSEHYKAKGLLASVETGYTFNIMPNFYLQPQAQATWMNVKAQNHREFNGTKVISDGNGNLRTRLGVRLFGRFDLSNGMHLRPYAEFNWLHNTRDYYVDMDGTRMNQKGAKNIAQAKLGLNAQFNEQLSLWGDVNYDRGKNNYRSIKLMMGIKYTF